MGAIVNSSLYNCTVAHTRMRPVRHSFSTRTFMFFLDLDEIEKICARVPLISRNRFNAYTFSDKDHIYRGHANLRANVETFLRENGVREPAGRIRLLTNLRVFGYVFNPVSFYVCDDTCGNPLAMLVEVHNTFGELKPFLLTREHFERNRYRDTRDKHFYISPFSELDHLLELRLPVPGERLNLQVINRRHDEETPFLTASLTGRRVPLTTSRLLSHSVRFPLITLRIMAQIHWHALRLWWKGLPPHAKDEHPELQRGIVAKAESAD